MTNLMPSDARGNDGPTNEERAAWAEVALLAFGRQTGTARKSVGDSDEAFLLVADLLADLAHWCDRNKVDLPSALASATQYYQAETGGAGEPLKA